MASFIQELHTWVNAQTWVPGVIQFNVSPLKPPYPYFTMVPVGDPGVPRNLCATDEGQTVVQFNGYSTDRYSLYEQMDELRKDILLARNNISNYSLWDIRTTGLAAFGTEDELIYRYLFELTAFWEA
jgi:hypothetical protein